MKPASNLRSRASLLVDLRIIVLGVWCFLLQCWKSRGLARKALDE